MPENVVSLPATTTYTVEQALNSALQYDREVGLSELILVGHDVEGELFIRSSRMTRKDALWLAEKLRSYAMGV